MAPLPPPEARHHQAAKELHEARSARASTEQRLGHYLQAAAEAGPLLGQGAEAPALRDIYNAAAAEVTVLLRSADGGRLWNHPLTVTAGGTSYQLRFAPASRQEGTWAPGYFTAFETPRQVHERRIRLQVRAAGFGGTLVGINRPADPAKFYFPSVGVAGAVTAVLDFKPAAPNSKTPCEVVLSLHDPTLRETVQIAGVTRPLAADFTAPLAYYPHPPFLGLMEAMRVDRYYRTASLTMLQPYDPERIPIVFVHGLISEPGMWRETIDAVESDPVLRGRFQFWAFGYPTGDPISISALQFRESLAGVYRLYPRTMDMVLISHSLGGLLSKMQMISTGRAAWDGVFGSDADRLYAKVPPDNLVKRALIFEANPRVKRVVFICVPHRGSPLADNSIGAIGLSLIHLPAQVVDTIQSQIGHSLAVIGGKKGFVFPPSVHGLSPKSTLLHALDTRPIQAPHHTIAGDRGKGDTPNSSDGVVLYKSSHLNSAQSELIVPGPHGSFDLPQTIAEIQRLLHLHLQATSRRATATVR
jgi:pimeloyl-ACP methyl ester carboxylesterase